jgi:phospholipase C
MTEITRRQFLAGAAGTALSLSGVGVATARAGSPALPSPESSGIDHIVVVMMENRSFDHFLGWLPAAEGRQRELEYPDLSGNLVPTYPLAPDFTGCGFGDPDHSYDGARVEFDNGACDGWLRVNDVFSIGFYEKEDLPFLGQAAPGWTTCDNYFAAFLGPTFPNRFYQHSGVTDRISNTTDLSTLPTIWDRLAGAGLQGRYYFNNLPFLLLWGTKYVPIVRPFDAFLADCALGTLPEVAYVDPVFTIAGDEPKSNDDHPHDDIRAGETFLSRVYEAVVSSPNWERTLLVINFDEWGGFFEHVSPDEAPDVQPAYQRRGFRVPAVLVSPFARRHHVAHEVFDHTSVLRMIEWRWNLSPLSVRDATANNLADALDFGTNPSLDADRYRVPTFVSAGCTPPPAAAPGARTASPAPDGEWTALAELARRYGFDVG